MVSALRAQGVQAEIACTNDDGDGQLSVALNQQVEFEGVPVRFFKRFSPRRYGKLSSTVREFAYSRDFVRWLKSHIGDYDLIHIHALFSFTSSYTMRLARKRGVPYFAHPIGSLDDWSLQQSALRKKLYLGLVEKANLRGAARVHFTAELEQQQAMQKISGLTPLIVPLGLELPQLSLDARAEIRRDYQLQEDIKVLLFLGRIHPKKGLELLLQSLKKLDDQGVHLLIAGDGDKSYLETLKQQVKVLELSAQVTFLGHVQGQLKQSLLQGADLFALTSYSENFGIAVLEAMASATAPLISDNVPLSQQLIESKLGFVCQTDTDNIAKVLAKALNSDLIEIGAKARDYADKHHAWPNLAKRLLSAYSDCI